MARKALGKGLRALIPEPESSQGGSPAVDGRTGVATPGASADEGSSAVGGWAPAGLMDRSEGHTGGGDALRKIPVDAIVPNVRQPRTDWDPHQLEQLSRSMAETGLLEPILVRPQGSKFEIIAGERRWRAAKLLGWKELPALVRTLEDRESLEAALIENLQRDDLNPVDEARAYQALMAEFGLTHEQVSTRVGKDRSTVTNLLRLLRLPETVLTHVSRGTISMGHARVLVGLPAHLQGGLADRMASECWSVRQAEEWAARYSSRRQGRELGERRGRSRKKDEQLTLVEEQLVRHFGTEVHVRAGRKGGRIEISYNDAEELSRLLEMLGVVIS